MYKNNFRRWKDKYMYPRTSYIYIRQKMDKSKRFNSK